MIDLTQWFDAILRASWQGALFVAGAWIVMRLFKNTQAKSRSWIWPVVLTKFLLVAFVVWELPVLASKESSIIQLQPNMYLTDASIATAAEPKGWLIEQILFAIWIVGLSIILIKSVREYAILHRIKKAATDAPERVIQLCERVADKHITVKVHPDVPMPLVFGVFKPIVLLPSTLEQELDEEQLSMVLAHEVAHIMRRDTATAMYLFICHSLFFFHPAVWFAKHEWQIARESACDQYAIEKTNTDSRSYADMLIKVSVGAKRAPAFALSAVPAYKTLHRRIENMKNTTEHRGVARAGWLVALVLIGAAALPFALTQKNGSGPDQDRLPLSIGEPNTETLPEGKEISSQDGRWDVDYWHESDSDGEEGHWDLEYWNESLGDESDDHSNQEHSGDVEYWNETGSDEHRLHEDIHYWNESLEDESGDHSKLPPDQSAIFRTLPDDNSVVIDSLDSGIDLDAREQVIELDSDKD